MRETEETEHTGESPSPGHRDQGQVDKEVLKQRDTTAGDRSSEETAPKRPADRSSSSKS